MLDLSPAAKMLFRLIGGILLISIFHFVHGNEPDSCKNPNNNDGVCMPLLECPSLRSILEKIIISDSDKTFLRESLCKTSLTNIPNVCCTNDTSYGQRKELLPLPPDCGVADFSLEFPWMALLVYRTSTGKRNYGCGGTLISTRYLLTAAHCVTGPEAKAAGVLDSIVLGEYDLHSKVDCIWSSNTCLDPVVQVQPEEIIPHEGFDGYNFNNRTNDIALIRLDREVFFTDTVRPICLLSSLNKPDSVEGTRVKVAGWGRTIDMTTSNILQKVTIPIANFEDCRSRYSYLHAQVYDTNVCAGGIAGKGSCLGDSGGPLMVNHDGVVAVEGIVSFAYGCGQEDYPAVYTRVSSFTDWIKSKMKP